MIRVWQAKDAWYFSQPDDALKLFNEGGYAAVANVDTDEPEVAFEQTNSIECGWWENRLVEPLFEGRGCRSTSVGDIMECNGKMLLVAPFGFKELA